MKMVKSLLLGAAAGLVAIAGAQAADLPVKAKPVQYVKICSLYGVGFYYIPGTDTCIKIGGFVRTEWNINSGGSFGTQQRDQQTRATIWNNNRTRLIVSADVRSQTAYGTLRSYGRAGWQWGGGAASDFQVGGSQGGSTSTTITGSPTGNHLGSSSTTYFDRAFIQLGGWTFGKTQSFFDFFPTGAFSLMTNTLHVDTGGSGVPLFAYTYAFGNGLTATLSAEDATESRQPIVAVGAFTSGTYGNVTATSSNSNLSFTAGGTSINSNAGNLWPDLVGNIRLDQAWGSAQVMGVLHNNRAAYYYTTLGGTTAAAGGSTGNNQGHPGDKLGWAIGGGLTLNLPMIAPGDTISAMMTYCNGATRYCANPAGGVLGSGAMYGIRRGNTIGVGWLEDSYFDALGGQLELSQAWSVAIGYNHKWNSQWQTSLYGTYLNFEADSAVVNSGVGTGASCANTLGAAQGPIRTNAAPGAGCRDWSAFQIGSRTLWNPVANLDVGVDVIYQRVNSAYSGASYAQATAGTGTTAAGLVCAGGPAVAGGAATGGNICVGDVGVWSGIVRIQRNFWP